MVKITITGFAGRDTEKHGKLSCNSISAGARINGTRGTDGKYEYINEWYDVIAFGKELDTVKKGAKVKITGTMEYNKFVDKNGNDKVTRRLIVETVEFPIVHDDIRIGVLGTFEEILPNGEVPF